MTNVKGIFALAINLYFMRIIIISLDNWGFNKFIAENLKNKEIEVINWNFNDWIYNYPSPAYKTYNFFLKNILGINLKKRHLERILKQKIKKLQYQDKILLIKPNRLNKNTLRLLQNKTDEMIAFFNDSIDRSPSLKKTIPYFDRVFSFEPKDVAKYNLIKINNYIYTDISTKVTDNKYDIFNISSLDKRQKPLKAFANYFSNKNLNTLLIAYASENNAYLSNIGVEITNKTYSINQMLEFLKQSKIILDIQRPCQKGLSFRVFESLSFQKKMITTNKDIINYDFYNPNNIFVVEDINRINISHAFFKSEYQKIDPSIVQSYHISNWTNVVFNLPA